MSLRLSTAVSQQLLGPLEAYRRTENAFRRFPYSRYRETDGKEAIRSRWNSALLIKSLLLLKVVPEVIDPVVGSFQLGCIEGQIRGI